MKTVKRGKPTREQLLQAAMELMLEKGYTATTLDEICKKAGVTKGGFFHYFVSKEDLGKAALEHFWQSRMQMMQNMTFNKVRDPLKRLHGFLDAFITLAKNHQTPRSCLIGNLTQELSMTNPAIRKVCAEKFTAFADMLRLLLDEAGVKYPPPVRIDTKSLAEHFTAILQGSLLLAKAKEDADVIEKNIEHFRSYIGSLFGRKR